jgi:serine/threonine protein kinase
MSTPLPGIVLTAYPSPAPIAPWLTLNPVPLHRGRSFAIHEVEGHDGRWLAKVPWLPAEAPAEVRAERNELLRREHALLELGLPALPAPGGLFRVAGAGGDALVLSRTEGQTLLERARRSGPLSLAEGLELARGIATALRGLHAGAWVARGLTPEHVVLGEGGRVSLVGTGNFWPRATRVSIAKDSVDPRYSAPEVLWEVSGTFVVPRADLYSLGALLAFAWTGEHPTGRPDAPFTDAAYDAFERLPNGARLLIAHNMQALHKHRFASVDRLLPHLDLETLPSATTQGFGTVSLTRPLERSVEAPTGPVGSLSPGPLVSRPRPSSDAGQEQPPSSPRPLPEEASAELSRPFLAGRMGRAFGWALLALLTASIAARLLR